VSDRAYVLRSGEVVATGTGSELLARTDLFDTFVGGHGAGSYEGTSDV
jgi:ABC-type branched-subunit amino acid transport system ATPase component